LLFTFEAGRITEVAAVEPILILLFASSIPQAVLSAPIEGAQVPGSFT